MIVLRTGRIRRRRIVIFACPLLVLACAPLLQCACAFASNLVSYETGPSVGSSWSRADAGPMFHRASLQDVRITGNPRSDPSRKPALKRTARAVFGVPKVAYRIPGAPNAEWIDLYNRLYRERIVFLGKEIDDALANQIIGVLLYLDSEDSKKPIYLYINSMGGSVLAGLAIYDAIQHIKSRVITINVGIAASMASFLLAAGEKGRRMALPHSRVMMHQAMGGAQGQAEDIKVESQQILRIHGRIAEMYADMTGKDLDVIREDLKRDNFMSATEAKHYGIVDQVIELRDFADFSVAERT